MLNTRIWWRVRETHTSSGFRLQASQIAVFSALDGMSRRCTPQQWNFSFSLLSILPVHFRLFFHVQRGIEIKNDLWDMVNCHRRYNVLSCSHVCVHGHGRFTPSCHTLGQCHVLIWVSCSLHHILRTCFCRRTGGHSVRSFKSSRLTISLAPTISPRRIGEKKLSCL